MIAEVKSISEIAKSSTGLITGFYDRYVAYQKLLENDSSYLRLIYLEIVNNLTFLETVSMDSITKNKISINDNAIQELTEALSTEMMEVVFYAELKSASSRIYKLLQKEGQIQDKYNVLQQENEDGTISKVKAKILKASVLKTMVYVVTRIQLLKKLSKQSDLKIYKNVRLKTRLVNINQRLLMLKSTFSEFEDIKEMAR